MKAFISDTLAGSETLDWAAWMRDRGFEHWGVTDIDLHDAEAGLLQWLEAGFHGDMDYMARHGLKRARPAELVPGTVSVLMVAVSYRPLDEDWLRRAWSALAETDKGNVSLYARGRDYHKVLRLQLQALGQALQKLLPSLQFRAFCDSAPVMEVELAQRAGLGWRGKHTLLLNRKAGSIFFLGSLFLNLPPEKLPKELVGAAYGSQSESPNKSQRASPNKPQRASPDALQSAAVDHCGSCRACLDICPTRAIVAPYRLDARRCISYLTIEYEGPIPLALREAIGNRIYGCDDCQLICPWNKFASAMPKRDFAERPDFVNLSLSQALAWSEAEFLKKTEGMAIRRIGHRRWQRNLVIALGNFLGAAPATGQEEERQRARKALHALKPDANPMLAEHIDWALSRDRSQPGLV